MEQILRSATIPSENSESSDENDDCEPTKQTILPYVEAEIVSQNKDEPNYRATIFLDSGSMGTFIDQSLANKLNLPILHRENLTFNVFGENELKPKIYNAYSFKLVKKRWYSNANKCIRHR